jgi:Fe-S oxidoreductase
MTFAEINVIDTVENCRYCLMCRHVCPVGHVTAKETFTPHGWGLLIASVNRGMLEWNEDTVNALYSCSDCGTCRAHCVTDQPLPDAIAAVRAQVVEKNLAPQTVYAVHQLMEEYSNPYQKQKPIMGEGIGEVALFVGDEAQFLWPEAVEAALRLLRAVGLEPVLVGVGRNNGYMAGSLGFPETARTLMQATFEELSAAGAKKMLVLSAGDFYAFGKLHAQRLDITLPEGLEVVEVTTVLANALEEGKISFDQVEGIPPYAYVDPTHTVRHRERHPYPRALLAAVYPKHGAREIFWRMDRAHPSGNVALQFTNPHIANHLTYSRLGRVAEAGARIAVCEAPGTLNQLQRHSHLFGLQIQGLYELLVKQIK